MDFNELLITTGVDALVRLVREKQNIQLSVAAELLNIPVSTVEEWAHVLEEEGILKIEYHLTKVFLLWLQPTEDTVKRERESFYKEKGTIVKEIENVQNRLEPELKSLHEMKISFSKMYDKLRPKLEELEKQLATTSVGGEAFFEKQKETVEKNQETLTVLETSLAELKTELQQLQKENSTKELKKSVQGTYNEVETLIKELDGIIERAKDEKNEIPQEMPGGIEIKKKFDELGEAIREIKNSQTELEENVHTIKDSTGILEHMESEIKEHESNAQKMKNELDSLLEVTEKVRRESSRLFDKIKEDRESLGRFSESVEVARDIVHRFPKEQDLLKELTRMKKTQNELEGKVDALNELVQHIPNVKNIKTEFDALEQKAGAKKEELEEKADEIKRALQENTSTYKTFEKIKERIVVSIKEYTLHIETLGNDLKKIKKENERALSDIEKTATEYQNKVKKQETVDVLKAAQGIQGKKELLDEINASIEGLSESSENISRRLNMLAKEAQIIELRGSSSQPITSGMIEKESELIQTVKLTRQEEEEFKRKREELKDLIKKLWEES